MLEDILKQIRAMLQNQLPGKLDQIELERADGVALENVQSFLIQVRQRDGRQKYPTITLWGNVTAAPTPSLEGGNYGTGFLYG